MRLSDSDNLERGGVGGGSSKYAVTKMALLLN